MKEFTPLVPSSVIYQKLFKSSEVIVNKNNTVKIIAQDKYGQESYSTINFIGQYTGIMFSDESGVFYSDDMGNVLKYLDMGTLVAGQTSLETKIKLINSNPFSVSNVR